MTQPVESQCAEASFVLYQSVVEDLRLRTLGESVPGRTDASVACALVCKCDLQRLIDLSAEPHGRAGSAGEWVGRLPSLNDELEALFDVLGRDKIPGLLVAALETEVERYESEVGWIVECYVHDEPEVFETYVVDDITNMDAFSARDSIECLLAELGGQVPEPLTRRVAAVDGVLREQGKHLYGPLIKAGVLQRARALTYQPMEHWWYFLDELPDLA